MHGEYEMQLLLLYTIVDLHKKETIFVSADLLHIVSPFNRFRPKILTSFANH